MATKVNSKNKITIPKEMILEDKYPLPDLEGAEKILAQGLSKEEIIFPSGKGLIKELKNRQL